MSEPRELSIWQVLPWIVIPCLGWTMLLSHISAERREEGRLAGFAATVHPRLEALERRPPPPECTAIEFWEDDGHRFIRCLPPRPEPLPTTLAAPAEAP